MNRLNGSLQEKLNTMTKKQIFAASVLALSLLTAPMAFADSDRDGREGRRGEVPMRLGVGLGIRNHDGDRTPREGDSFKLHGTVSAISGPTITLIARNGTTYTVNALNAEIEGAALADIKVGDAIKAEGALVGTTLTATEIRVKGPVATLGRIAGGVVTSIDGATFTVNAFGPRGTTTVTTSASTTFNANGQATTSSALAVGSKVLLAGTPGAADASFAASVVLILSEGFGHLKHFLFR